MAHNEHGARHKQVNSGCGLGYYDILLQNATNIIIKCDSFFITKCEKILIRKASVIAKCHVYYRCVVHTLLKITA